jgi:hypothetical protein
MSTCLAHGSAHPAHASATPDDVPRGCAWFDSSLDLHHGLKVRELELADAACGEAFLSQWLAWATGGGRAGMMAASPLC